MAINNKDTQTLPWTEKYRPQSFDDLIAHQEILQTITRLIDADQLPHLLLYGPPGTGKTTAILACARRMYGNSYRSMILELNASDERGIDVVRQQIKDFASTKKIFSQGVKLIVLDEADAMTSQAQAALRRVMEKYTKNTRFCLICNYISKITPAIQSRCTRFRFAPISPKYAASRMKYIAEQEGVQLSEDGMEALLKLGAGDMRKTINILQSTHMAYGLVNLDNIYLCTGNPLPSDIEQILYWMLNDDYSEAYKSIKQLKGLKGLALADILREIHMFVLKIQFPEEVKMQLIADIAQLEFMVANGANETLQTASLIGSFQIAREATIRAQQDDTNS